MTAVRRSRMTPAIVALVVLLIGVGATTAAARWREREARAADAAQLRTLSSETATRITSSLVRYADLLTSLSAFQRQDDRSLAAYQAFVESVGLDSHPGVEATAYVAWVDGKDELAALTAERRASGQPGFEPRVTDLPGQHAIVAYAAPEIAGLEGLDLTSDPGRWQALRDSADQAVPKVVSTVSVPEEWGIDTSAISSFQVYAPFYEPGRPVSSILDRRQALAGWTSVSIDVREVLAAMVLDDNPLDVALYDAITGQLLTESAPGVAEVIERSATSTSERLDISGLQMEMRSVLPGDQRLDDGVTSVAVSGLVAALAAAYGAYATLRYRRALLVRAEAERQRAELMSSRFHAAVDDAPVGVVIAGFDGRVEVVNRRLLDLMQVPHDGELSIFDHYLPEDHEDVVRNMGMLLEGQVDHLVKDRQLVRRDGSRIWCRIHSSLLRDADGEPVAIVGHVQDIEAELAAVAELRSATEELAHQAAHDPLTGLANRVQLEQRLEAALARSSVDGTQIAVAYLDLDGFKAVNDTHGHAAGDDLLRVVAAALRDEVREGDLIARIGGDEFVIVLHAAALASALATAERVRIRLQEPIQVDRVDHPLHLSASIGVAAAAPGDSVASLLRGADAALYEAKRRGRNRIEVSTHDTERDGQAADRGLAADTAAASPR